MLAALQNRVSDHRAEDYNEILSAYIGQIEASKEVNENKNRMIPFYNHLLIGQPSMLKSNARVMLGIQDETRIK